MQVFGMITLFLAGAGALTTDAEQKVFLDMHNELRAKHDSPAMTWDETIASFAQKHCNELKDTDKFEHSKDSGYGENLYKSGGRARDVAAAGSVQGWYDEINDYNYANPVFSMDTGHFTQVVWKDSVKLGCAISEETDNEMLVVWVCCNYSPPGNYGNQFEENVLPLKEDDKNDGNEGDKAEEKEEGKEEGQERGKEEGQERGKEEGQERGKEEGQERGKEEGQERGKEEGQERGKEEGQERGKEEGQERGKEEGQERGKGAGKKRQRQNNVA